MRSSEKISERILLVEDDLVFGKDLVKALESEIKDPVTWTKSLAETLPCLDSSQRYFAAVLDFVLPDATNGEIIDVVTQKGIPSIVFTSVINSELRKIVWSKKIVDYILKDDQSSLGYLLSSLKKLKANKNHIILIVDDSLFFRRAISDLLYMHQYKLITATNGKEALEALKRYPEIKLVITDFNMPGMDGCLLCKTIREAYSKEELAIIGMSSERDETMAARFIKSGANDFIIKQSFIREEFYCRVAQCIENICLLKQTKLDAIMDYLTGLYNRRFFFEKGEKLFLSSRQFNRPLCCAMIDVDHFKKVNDTYGHDVGDLVLQKLAEIFKNFVKQNELIARLGGEEFCFVISGRDGEDKNDFRNQIEKRFNALKALTQATKIAYGDANQKLAVTISIGISFNTDNDFSDMLKSADNRLYYSKKGGRNLVTVTG
ncbi:diguanylate cyclase [uncultured Desulfobacter sp.]|uniref:diguanylate cyclase n=1 Tax=uncultured Desulfobacter sp. TaxID=240139 RepID=UPI0029F59E85|nr:diguanylate cyclase [uncultured Desulfobacter sp.]